MNKIHKYIYLLLFAFSVVHAVDIPPKRELRGAWLSTVNNIDWPKDKFDSETKKQNDLKAYLHKLKDSGINTVFFQVRPSCDAMYKSDIEPWSYWFSGTQGQGPSVDWDPLEFAINEAHSLGMELHAWVNPYRAVFAPTETNIKDITYVSHGHVASKHPDWLLKSPNVYILNPGLPEVREYILSVFMDIVNRYDVDGLHIDDYFYFYLTDLDSLTYTDHSRGFNDIEAWRRDNVNLLISAIKDSINTVKPWVKWGVSPRPIWKNGYPDVGSNGTYNTSFCDPIAWLQAGTVDYLIPQNYYAFDSYRDYGTLIRWWAEQAGLYGRHCYSGQAMYKARDWEKGEVLEQVDLNRELEDCKGSVFFTANDFFDNHKSTVDSLKKNYFAYPALWPIMDWKIDQSPPPFENVTYKVEENGYKTISWNEASNEVPSYASVLYRAPHPIEDISDMSNAYAILIDRENEFIDSTSGSFYYAVTSLNRYKQESEAVWVQNPFVQLSYPTYDEKSCPLDQRLSWQPENAATSYQLILEREHVGNTVLVMDTVLIDTIIELSLKYQSKYYWKVKANVDTLWSPLWHFTTELAPQVETIFPQDQYGGCELEPVLRWKAFEDAQAYDVRISRNEEMSDFVDVATELSDTSYQSEQLDFNRRYYWQLRSNKYDRWTYVQTFKTREEFIETLWEKTALALEYPAFLDSNLEATGLALGTYQDNDILLVLQSYQDSVKVNALDILSGDSMDFDLNMTGVEGGTHKLRDIELTKDGVIFAVNYANIGEVFKVYYWEDKADAPRCVYEAEDVAYRLGSHITVTGRYDDGSVILYAPAAMSDRMLKLEWNTVSKEFEATQLTLERGNNWNPGMDVDPSTGDLYVTSNDFYIRHFTSSGANIDWMKDNLTMPKNANSIAAFSYNDKTYIAGYVQDTESAHIIDVTDGVRTALKAGATYRMGINENDRLLGDIEILDHKDGTFTIYVLGNQNGVGAYTFDAASAMVDIADIDQPNTFELSQNYPNPFNPVTTIQYQLKKDTEISVSIFDLSGKHITTLYDGFQMAGDHELKFNASELASGQYLYRLTAGDVSVTRKMVLLK